MSIPDHNNVYGHLKSLDGLKPVLAAVKPLASDQALIYRSSYDGAETLRFSSKLFDFESTPLGISDHLLSGAVAGAHHQIVDVVQAISLALTKANIEHQFEINDPDGQLVEIVPANASPNC